MCLKIALRRMWLHFAGDMVAVKETQWAALTEQGPDMSEGWACRWREWILQHTWCTWFGYLRQCIVHCRHNYNIKEENKMAYKISDECISCGACEAECPAGAISEGASHYEIDPDACLDCGACAATCPTGSISEA